MSKANTYNEQYLKLLTHKEKFQQQVYFIRKKWKLPKNNEVKKLETDYNKWLKKYPKQVSDFNTDIKNLLVQFKISYNFYSSICAYVMYNNFNKSLVGEGITKLLLEQNPRVFSEKDSITGKKRLFLEIYTDTTLQNIADIWKSHIQPNQSLLQYSKKENTRKKPMPNFDLNERAYLLSKEDITYSEIAKILKKEFNTKNLMYDDVAKIISRFKEKIQDI